jgi:tetratricopeptide (TPR) repeat protein
MHLVCIHCGHHFDHEPPAYARESATAVCSSCGRDTPANEGWGLDGGLPDGFAAGPGVESRVFCFNCGKAMTPREGELIPVCNECRQEAGQPLDEGLGLEEGAAAPLGDEPVADWMIRKANGNVYGPFPAETIVEWIRARKINADEEVAHIGGAWRLFGQHEEFGKYFEKTAAAAVPEGTAEIDFRRKSPVRDALRGMSRFIVIAAVLGGLGIGIYIAMDQDLLVVPEDAIERVAREVERSRNSEPEAERSEDANKLLADLAAAHPELGGGSGDHGTSQEWFLRGRTLMLRDGVQDLIQARSALEKAVILNPNNALALSSLAELYNVMVERSAGSLDLQRQSIYLIDMAEGTGDYPAEVLRSRAAFLIYSGNEREGVGVARQALAKNPADPALHFLLGVASARQAKGIPEDARTHFDKALEFDAGFHQVWYELGKGAEEVGNLREAISHLDRKIELDPRSAAAHTLLGVIYERVGDYKRATTHYDKAVSLHPSQRVAVSRRAILAYQLDGEPERAATLLESLLAADIDLKIRERKELGVHLSAARRLGGDVEGALAAAETVLKEDKAYSPALFHRGLALVAAGRPHEAVPSFTRAESPELDKNVRARIAFFQGHAALSGDQIQDAMEAFGRSASLDQDWVPGYLWSAHVSAMLGDGPRAANAMLDHVGRDPLDYSRVRDPDLFFEPLPSLEPVVKVFEKLVSEQTFAPELNAAAGVLLFHQGRYDRASQFLRTTLKQDERNEAARCYSGLAEYQKGRNKAAAAHFLALIDVSHNRGVYHAYMADSLLSLGRVDEAVTAYEKALGYGANTAWTHTRLAEALARSGDSEAARKQLSEAIKLDPRAVAPRQQAFQLNL